MKLTNLISWTGWTKDDWKEFFKEVENASIWGFFTLFIALFMMLG